MPDLRRRLSGTLSVRVVALALAAVLVAGCSDDDPAADPSEAPETSSEGTASATEDPSPTESTPTGDPSVPPATGPVLAPETGGIRLRLPEDWTIDDQQANFLVNGSGPRGGRIFVSSFPALSADAGVDELAQAAAEVAGLPDSSIRPPVTVGGARAFHLVGRVGSSPQEAFGTLVDGDILTVTFDLRGVPEGERQPLIESVLATVEWA